MNPRRILQATALTSALLAMTGPLAAQVNYRVSSASERGDGHALDANNQVGSRGYNTAVSSQYSFDYGQRANEIITGNVTGLGGFRGNSPILANNAFRAELPSAGLAQFRASSFGLPDLANGRTNYGIGSYYDPQAIIPDASSINRGLNVPGTNYLGSPYRRPPLPQERELQRQLMIPDPTDRRIQNNQPFDPGMRLKPTPAAASLSALSASPYYPAASPYAAAADSSIFGMPPLSPAPLTPATPNRNDAMGLRATPGSALDANRNPLDGRPMANSPLEPVSVSPRGRRPGDFSAPYSDPAIRDANPLEGPNVPSGPIGPDGRPLTPSFVTKPITGGDRYLDLVAAVQAAQESGIDNIGYIARRKGTASSEKQPDSKEESKPAMPGMKPDAAQPKVEPARDPDARSTAAAIRWARAQIDNPITTFTGQSETRLNEMMGAAEASLRKGRYYDAGRQYDLAAAMEPENPLPYLGRGHALAAAGDYMSAVLSLENGIERFPQIAAFKLDLPSIVGRHDAFDIRRADLEKRLEKSDDYRLRFLLGYLELYSGFEERGLRNLEAAAKNAPAGSAIGTFHDLLTGKAPVPELSE